MNFPYQSPMPFFAALKAPSFVAGDVVEGFESYRDAVLWCWQNRPHRGMNEPDDQAMCARHLGVHAPHMSRYVSKRSKAPMDLKPDLIEAFESYTGWRGVSQFLNKRSHLTILEQVIAERAAA